MEPVLQARPRGEWQARLDAVGVPSAPVQSMAEALADPQTAALGILQAASDGFPLVGLPFSLDGLRPPLRRDPPGLGADDDLLWRDEP